MLFSLKTYALVCKSLISKYSILFLFNIRNCLPEVINIQRRKAELTIILPRVSNFDIKQKRLGIFVLLYATNTKQDLGG